MTTLQKSTALMSTSPVRGVQNGRAAEPHAAGIEINSCALLAGGERIAIRHGERLYWLRATRQGKLLLTK